MQLTFKDTDAYLTNLSDSELRLLAGYAHGIQGSAYVFGVFLAAASAKEMLRRETGVTRPPLEPEPLRLPTDWTQEQRLPALTAALNLSWQRSQPGLTRFAKRLVAILVAELREDIGC